MALIFIGILLIIAFLALGLPDALLGASWPTMGVGVNVPLAWAGGIAVVIAACSIIAALSTDGLIQRIGVGGRPHHGYGVVIAASIVLSSIALLGFSYAPNYVVLLIFAIPYGLGAGGLSASLDGYVAQHYASRYMSWLHAIWSFGCAAGHTILGFTIMFNASWRAAYRNVGWIEIAIAIIALACIPMWKYAIKPLSTNSTSTTPVASTPSHTTLADIATPGDDVTQHLINEQQDMSATVQTLAHTPARTTFTALKHMPGLRMTLLAMFSYATVMQTTMLWASSYMVHAGGMSIALAGKYASLFFVGLTVGLVICGFLTFKLADVTLVYVGEVILFIALIIMLFPFAGAWRGVTAPIMLGLGCAPIAPSLMHLTPQWFGKDNVQRSVGALTAANYVATMLMPALFGIIAQTWTIHLMPWFLLAFTCVFTLSFQRAVAAQQA